MKYGLLIRDKQLFGVEVKQYSKNVVASGEYFVQKWKILNLSNKQWKNLHLRHIDKSQMGLYPYLKVKQHKILIPDTQIGESAEIKITFKAPNYPCCVASHWNIIDEKHHIVLDRINLKVTVLSHPEIV